MRQTEVRSAQYQAILMGEYENRRAKNASYSLRAFAQFLNVDSGTVSRLIRGKQIPTSVMATRILAKLRLEAPREKAFLASLRNQQRRRDLKRMDRHHLIPIQLSKRELNIHFFEYLTKWYHTAILELTMTKNFVSDPAHIAQRLGISVQQTQEAIQTLLNLGMVELNHGILVKRDIQLTTSHKLKTTEGLRKNQVNYLEQAIQSIDRDDFSTRSMTSVLMAVDPTRVASAKKMIRAFNAQLCQYLEKGNRTHLYNLSVALHPLERKL